MKSRRFSGWVLGTPFQKNWRFFDGIWHWEHAQDIGLAELSKWNHYCNGKAYVWGSKAKEIALVENGGKCGLYHKQCPTKILCSATPKEMWNGKRPWIAHMRVFKTLAYAMVLVERMGKFDAEEIKFVFLGHYEDMKAYRMMCLATKKIIKNKIVVFMKYSGSIWINLEMCPSRINEGPMVVDLSSTLFF